MSHSYRTIPDAKFEFGIFSIFGNMTHKLSLSKRGDKSLKNEFFMSRDIPFNPELTPPWSISAISKQKKFLYFKNVLDISRKKKQQHPGCSILQKNFSKYLLKIKLKAMNF